MSGTFPVSSVRLSANANQRESIEDKEENCASYLNVIPLYMNNGCVKNDKNATNKKENAQVVAVLLDQTHLLISSENTKRVNENELSDENDVRYADEHGVFIINICRSKECFNVIKALDSIRISENISRHNSNDNKTDNFDNISDNDNEKCDWNSEQEVKLVMSNQQHRRNLFTSPFCFNGIVRDYTKQTLYNLVSDMTEDNVNKNTSNYDAENHEGCKIKTNENISISEQEHYHGPINNNAKYEQFSKADTSMNLLNDKNNNDCILDNHEEAGSCTDMECATKELENLHFAHEERDSEKSECENDIDDITHTECPVFEKRECVNYNDSNINTLADKTNQNNKVSNFDKRDGHDYESTSFSSEFSESCSESGTEIRKSNEIRVNTSESTKQQGQEVEEEVCNNFLEENKLMGMEQVQDNLEHHFIVSNSVSHSIWAVVINSESLSFRVLSYDCFFNKRFNETKRNTDKIKINNAVRTNDNISNIKFHVAAEQNTCSNTNHASKTNTNANTDATANNKLSNHISHNVCKSVKESDNVRLGTLPTEMSESNNNNNNYSEISPIIGCADGVAGFVDGHFTVARFNKPASLCWRLPGENAHTQEHWNKDEQSKKTVFFSPPSSSLTNSTTITPTHTKTSTNNDLPEYLAQEHKNTNLNSLVNSYCCEVLFISDTGNHAIRYANFRSRLVRTIVGITSTSPKVGYRDGSCLSSLLTSAIHLTWIEVANKEIRHNSTIATNMQIKETILEQGKSNMEVETSKLYANKSHGAIAFIDKGNRALRMISPITLDASSSPNAQRSQSKNANVTSTSAATSTSTSTSTEKRAKEDKADSDVQPFVTTIFEGELQEEHQLSAGKDIHNREVSNKTTARERSHALNLSLIALINQSNWSMSNLLESKSNLLLLANESIPNKLFYLNNNKYMKSNQAKQIVLEVKEKQATTSNTAATTFWKSTSHDVAPTKNRSHYHEIELKHANNNNFNNNISNSNDNNQLECCENFSPAVLLPCSVFSEHKCVIAHAIIAVDVNKNVVLLYKNDQKEEEWETENCASAQSALIVKSETCSCERKPDIVKCNVEADIAVQELLVDTPQCEGKNTYAILESGMNTLVDAQLDYEYCYRFRHPHVLPPLPSTYLIEENELPLSHRHRHTKHAAETSVTNIKPELHDQYTPNEINSLFTSNEKNASNDKTRIAIADEGIKNDRKENIACKVINNLEEQESVAMIKNSKVDIQLYPYSFPFMSNNNKENVNTDKAIESCNKFVRHNINVSSNFDYSHEDENEDNGGGKCDVLENLKFKDINNNCTALSGQRTRSKPITLMAPSAKTPTPERVKYKSTPSNDENDNNKRELSCLPCANNTEQRANPSVNTHTNKKLFSDKNENNDNVVATYKSDKHAGEQKKVKPFEELQSMEQMKSNKVIRTPLQSYAELFNQARSHSRSKYDVVIDNDGDHDDNSADFINTSVTDRPIEHVSAKNAFIRNAENVKKNSIINTQKDNVTNDEAKHKYNENHNHNHNHVEDSTKNKEIGRKEKRSYSSSSSSHKRLTSRAMSVHEAIHKRRNTTHYSALRTRSVLMCNNINTSKNNVSDVHMSTNVDDANTLKCVVGVDKKFVPIICSVPEQEDTPKLQTQIVGLDNASCEGPLLQLAESELKCNELQIVQPPQASVQASQFSESTLAPLESAKSHSCSTWNAHSVKRSAHAPPAETEQGTGTNTSSKEHDGGTVDYPTITHFNTCNGNSKYTNMHSTKTAYNNNDWQDAKRMEIGQTTNYTKKENEFMTTETTLCDSERRNALNVTFNARSEWYTSSVNLLFEVYRRFAKRKREVKVILESENNHLMSEEHRSANNGILLQENKSMTRLKSVLNTPQKMQCNYIISNCGNQCKKNKSNHDNVKHTHVENQANHFISVNNRPQLDQAIEVNKDQFLEVNNANVMDMHSKKINKLNKGKNSNNNYTDRRNASIVKTTRSGRKNMESKENLPNTLIATPQVQEIVTYEMSIISLWRFILSSNCLFDILAMMKECLCDRVMEIENNENVKNSTGATELCELHNRFTLTTEGVLLSLPTWDVRVLCEWLYLCGVRKHGYHTLVKMDFTNFRRLVLLLGSWNAKVQQYNHWHQHANESYCKNNNQDDNSNNNNIKNSENKGKSNHDNNVVDTSINKTKQVNSSDVNLNIKYKQFAFIDHVPALDAVEDATCVHMYRSAARRINNNDRFKKVNSSDKLSDTTNTKNVDNDVVYELMWVLSQNEQTFGELFDCFNSEVHISRSSNYTPPASVHTHLFASMTPKNDANMKTITENRPSPFTEFNKSTWQSHFASPHENYACEEAQSSLPHYINTSTDKETTLTPSLTRENNHTLRMRNAKLQKKNNKETEEQWIVPDVETHTLPSYRSVEERTVEYNPCDVLWKLKHLYSTTVSESLHISQNRTWGIHVMPFASFMQLWKVFDVCPALISFRTLEEIYITSLLEPLILNAQTQHDDSAISELINWSKCNLVISTTLQYDCHEYKRESFKTKTFPRCNTNETKSNSKNVITSERTEFNFDSNKNNMQERRKNETYAQLRCLRHSTALTSLMFVESFVRVAIWCFSTCGAADAVRFPTVVSKVHGLMTWMNKQIALGYVAERLHEHRKIISVNIDNNVNKTQTHTYMSNVQERMDNIVNRQKGSSMYLNRGASALLAQARNEVKTNNGNIINRGNKSRDFNKRRGKRTDNVFDANSVDRQSSLLSLKPFKIK